MGGFLMSVTSEVISEDDVQRVVRETFTEDGKVACVWERVELKNPPPPPIDIAALRTTVSKATTVTALRGVMLAYLDAVAADQG